MKRKAAAPKTRKTNLYYTIAIAAAALLGLFLWANWQPAKGPTVKAYFFQNEKLVPVERRQVPDRPLLTQAIEALLAGPTDEEKRSGLTTALPAGVKLRLAKADRSLAIVDLSRSLENYGGGSAKLEGLIAQLVYTATAVRGIDRAWIWVEGEREVVLGGEGLVLDRPLGRQDVKY